MKDNFEWVNEHKTLSGSQNLYQLPLYASVLTRIC